MIVLVTGSAGFIGFHVAVRLLAEGHTVVGFDGMTPYYDVSLKEARRSILSASDRYVSVTGMLEDREALQSAFRAGQPEVVIHLAAQAGVRYSLQDPGAYIASNMVGSWNLLELLKANPPRHLLLASTSSVYGGNAKVPFEETDKADEPLSLYAASKKSMEAMAHSYAHLHRIPTTAMRFFSVYGPWGRPDMALFKFVSAMTQDQPIELYGEGRMSRDFTYIDDIVEAVVRLAGIAPDETRRLTAPGVTDTLSAHAPYRVVNLCGGRGIGLSEFVAAIEAKLGRSARTILLPMQSGDAPDTLGSPALLEALTGFLPSTPLAEGVGRFVDWYRGYNRPPRSFTA